MAQQNVNYARRRGARQREPPRRGDVVWITNQQMLGAVQSAAESPRSYFGDTDTESLRRYSFHLKPVLKAELTKTISEPYIDPNPHTTQSQRIVSPVNRPLF